MREEGEEYLLGNEELAIDRINVLDCAQRVLDKSMKVDLGKLWDKITPLPEEELVANDTPVENKVNVAVVIWGESTMRGYEIIMSELIATYVISTKDLPSYFILNMSCPKIGPLSFPSNVFTNFSNLDAITGANYLGVNDCGVKSLVALMINV